jgi:hypothetical protein
MSSWVVRLGIRSVDSLCSGNDNGPLGVRCRAVPAFNLNNLCGVF